jgi:hypothetical protein
MSRSIVTNVLRLVDWDSDVRIGATNDLMAIAPEVITNVPLAGRARVGRIFPVHGLGRLQPLGYGSRT